jgi:hypothetical protein
MKALQTLLMRCAALALLAACPPVLFSGCGSEGTTQPDGRDAPEEVSDGSDAAEEEIVQEDADILAEAADSIDDDPVSEETVHPACDPMTDHGCIMVRIGEREFLRTIADYETLEFNDEGTTRTVIHLWQLVDEEITTQPDQQRYKIYGTDGYTFSDYLYWEDFLGGYIEIGTRRVVYEPALELPRLFRVKDAYLIVALPL